MSNPSGSETISRADLLGLSTQPNEPPTSARGGSFSVRAGRRSSAVAISLILHLSAAVVVLYAVNMAAPRAVPLPPRNLTFVEVSPKLPVEPVLRVPPLSLPRLTAETVIRATTLPMPRLDEPAPLARENPHVDPPPAAEPVKRELPTRADPVKPAAPVIVGAFQSAPAGAIKPNPGGQVHPTGFDAPSAKAPDLKLPTTVVGAFEPSAAGDVARPGSDRSTRASVADAGFGGVAPAAAPSTAPRAVGEAGFGNASIDGRGRASEPKHADVQRSGFDDVHVAPPVARPSPVPARVDVPVEILFKPSPAYTDDARALKLEGEVLLEVEFAASGVVRVLRVVRGLGHGLDETAARAAEAIRFKPAQAGGHPIDFRTTVHIVFRLT